MADKSSLHIKDPRLNFYGAHWFYGIVINLALLIILFSVHSMFGHIFNGWYTILTMFVILITRHLLHEIEISRIKDLQDFNDREFINIWSTLTHYLITTTAIATSIDLKDEDIHKTIDRIEAVSKTDLSLTRKFLENSAFASRGPASEDNDG